MTYTPTAQIPNPSCNTWVNRFSRTDYFFLLFLSILVVVYAFHLFPFTLFEGFATFSNDAANYVLFARKWSPFFAPSAAELHTWPVQTLPPGFAWALAITGASESLWLSHLLVSISMLASIFLFGWMAYRQLGWLTGSLLALGACLLPGAVTSSLGILSENLYLFLSLVVLLLYSYIKKSENVSWAWYLLLLIFLSLTILTRSVGIALVAAIFVVPVFAEELSRKQKIGFAVIALSSIVSWLSWSVLNPHSSEFTYAYYVESYISGSEAGYQGILESFWQNIQINLLQILSSWNHYLSLSHPNVWFFQFSYGLLLLCLIGLGLRLYQRKLDAVYLMFYLAILIIWRYPEEMMRFLHPIVFLLILQPVLYFASISRTRYSALIKTSLMAVILTLITNSIIIQGRLLEQRDAARDTKPDVAHSYEYYDSPSREFGRDIAIAYTSVMSTMTISAQRIPVHGVVATVKHANYSILADRRAVNLVAIVPYPQQLCNLKIKDVDAVFFSGLTTKFNKEGISLLEQYRDISSDVWKLAGEGGEHIAYGLIVDRRKLDLQLAKEGYNCQSYREHL